MLISRSKELVICSKCKGKGKVDLSTWPDIQNGRSCLLTCDECNGTGRKLRITQIEEKTLTQQEIELL